MCECMCACVYACDVCFVSPTRLCVRARASYKLVRCETLGYNASRARTCACVRAKNKEMEDLQNGHKNLLGSFAEENERVVQEVKSKSTLKLKLNELYNYWESKQTQSFFLWHKRVLLLRHHKNLKMIEGERSLETSGFAVKLVLGKIIKHLHAVKHRAFKIWSLDVQCKCQHPRARTLDR